MVAPPTETRRDLDSAATSHRGDRIFNRGVTVAAFTALPLPPRLVASPMMRFSISQPPRSSFRKTSPLLVGPCWEPGICSCVTTRRTRCPCR